MFMFIFLLSCTCTTNALERWRRPH